jgi:hypothetical protein
MTAQSSAFPTRISKADVNDGATSAFPTQMSKVDVNDRATKSCPHRLSKSSNISDLDQLRASVGMTIPRKCTFECQIGRSGQNG